MNIKLMKKDAKLPRYATAGSAAFDLFSTHDGEIHSGCSLRVSTGVAIEIPEGSVLLLFGRSGHGFNDGIRLANCVGVIDSDYRGEIMVKLHNDSQYPFYFNKDSRIAQGVILPIFVVQEWNVVDELGVTERGTGGLGSTGS